MKHRDFITLLGGVAARGARTERTHAGIAVLMNLTEDDREERVVPYPGHPAFTPVGATATPMAPPRSIALRNKPDTRTSSINALTAASGAGRFFGTTIFCGTLNKSSANSLVPGVAVESVVRRWRFAPSASIVRADRKSTRLNSSH